MKICELAFQLKQTIAPFSSPVISGLRPESLSNTNSSEFWGSDNKNKSRETSTAKERGQSANTHYAYNRPCWVLSRSFSFTTLRSPKKSNWLLAPCFHYVLRQTYKRLLSHNVPKYNSRRPHSLWPADLSCHLSPSSITYWLQSQRRVTSRFKPQAPEL